MRPLSAPILSALAITAAVRARRNVMRLIARVKNRHEAVQLGALDDRMLADIGLCRSDVRDAFSELPWRDPTDVLARRAAERRGLRPHASADRMDARSALH